MLAVFDTVTSASEAVSSIIRRGVIPVALEMLDQEIIKIVEPRIHAGYPLDAGAVLLIEIEGIPDAVESDSELVREACETSGASEIRVATSSEEREKLWEGRKAAIGAIGAAYPAFYLLDGVVPRTKLPQVMENVLAIASSYGFKCANMFHAGDGNLHPTLMFDPQNEGILDRVLECAGEIMRVCVDSGGAITGEHGVGLEKTSYMEWIYSQDDLEAMENIREAFGPADVFNPCKILPNGHGCAVGHAAEISMAMAGNKMSSDIYI
jgi:glycolate oxidase